MLKLLAQLRHEFVQTAAEEVLNISVSMYSKLAAVKVKSKL